MQPNAVTVDCERGIKPSLWANWPGHIAQKSLCDWRIPSDSAHRVHGWLRCCHDVPRPQCMRQAVRHSPTLVQQSATTVNRHGARSTTAIWCRPCDRTPHMHGRSLYGQRCCAVGTHCCTCNRRHKPGRYPGAGVAALGRRQTSGARRRAGAGWQLKMTLIPSCGIATLRHAAAGVANWAVP